MLKNMACKVEVPKVLKLVACRIGKHSFPPRGGVVRQVAMVGAVLKTMEISRGSDGGRY